MNPPDIHTVAVFLGFHRPQLRVMPLEALKRWLEFKDRHQGIAVAVIDDTIAGVAIAVRTHPALVSDPWTPWDESGPVLYIHHLVATRPEALAAILGIARKRIPDVAFLSIYGNRRNGVKEFTPRYTRRLVRTLASKLKE